MEILHFTGDNIPNNWKEELAKSFHLYELDRADWPVNGAVYQNRRIEQMTGEVGAHFELAVDDGLLGHSFLEFRRSEVNDTSYATLRIFVRKEYRRQGIASQLFKATLEELPEGINTLRISIKNDHPINKTMHEKFNIDPAFTMQLNVSKIREIDLDLVKEISERGKRLEDYEFVRLDQGNYPLDDEGYAALMEDIWNANSGKNTSKKKEKFPVSRLNGRFESVRAEGGTIYTTAAKSPEGEWVGLTEIFVYDTNPQLGTQSLTGVLKSHRGKGLGTLLKLRNMSFILGNTQVTHVLTGNASKNDAILRINNLIGFKPSVIYNIYELDITSRLPHTAPLDK